MTYRIHEWLCALIFSDMQLLFNAFMLAFSPRSNGVCLMTAISQMHTSHRALHNVRPTALLLL